MNSQLLFSSATGSVSKVSCGPGRQETSGVEVEAGFGLTFPRAGVYVLETPDGPIVADPTVAILHSAGDEHTTSHPTVEGDSNTDIQYACDVVESFVDSQGRFRARSIPISDHIVLRHRHLVAGLRHHQVRTPLEVDEELVLLLNAVIGVDPGPALTNRHRPMIDEARQYLAARFREDFGLVDISRAVGSSPFHLSRMFKLGTGKNLTEYRTELRIRFVIDRLADGEGDLGRLAAEAGFYDHAHMANTFRRRLGRAPSSVRGWLTG